MKILFLGSSRFSKIVLQKLFSNKVDISAVITQPDRPSGRGHKLTPTEVKQFALANNIEVYTFDKVRLHMEEIKKIDYDVAVVASFGQILPQEFLDYKLAINVHPSLLPKYRGATPIQSAILNGDKVTGVTIMKVAKEVDAGDIILQREFALNGEYYLELEEKLATLGGEMTIEVLKSIEDGSVKFLPQDNSKAVLVSKINKEDGKLDFSQSAKQIVNRVRALAEEVGCFLMLEDKIIKVYKACDVSEKYSVEQNRIMQNKKNFVIGCNGGAVEILSCQSPSGKMVSGRDYINGHNDILGQTVL